MEIPSVNIKKILYATDLSQNARYAFAYALSMANAYDAELVILHVISEVPNMDEKIIGYISADQWEEIKKRNLQEIRESLVGKKRDKVAIREVLDQFYENQIGQFSNAATKSDEIVVVRGNPVQEIITQAKSRNCDVIVMGTHGHNTFTEAVMGSTSRRVIRGSKIPVLIVRLPGTD
jgi:nucleotide-binding universal stress UspA family protein